MIRALESVTGPVEIRTDSMYVFKGCKQYLATWRASGWRSKGREITNADLWIHLSQLLADRTPSAVGMVKVKGHASQKDVLAGRVLAEDKK